MSKEETKYFDFFAFLVTSARGSIEEGVFSASLRLIDAASRVAELLSSESSDSFLKEMQTKIKLGMTGDYLASQERYIAFLDSIVEDLAVEIRKRNNL